MTAPDGGPARRRPADDELVVHDQLHSLQTQLSEIRDRHAALATDVAELGAQHADELQRLARDVATLGGTVSELSKYVSDVLGEPAARPATIDWLTLDRAAAEEAWSGLWQWLIGYYVPTWEPSRKDIPDCWTRHPAMREELSWLWCAHRAAYARAAQPATAVQWHTIWRSAAMRNLVDIARRTGCSEPGRCRNTDTGRPLDFSDHPVINPEEHWLTDGIEQDLARRSTPPPEPPAP